MPTLTSSYKIISTISTTYGEIRTYGKYTGQSMEDNCTYYRLKQTYYLRQYINTSSATGTLDGSVKKYGYTHFPKGETTIQEVSRTLYHRDDGSSPTVGVTTKWSAAFGGGGSKTVDIRMPSIDRLATVNNATDFTDETTPTVTFSNPGGFTVYPYLNFYDNNNNLVYQLYRNSETITSPYTWNITSEERSALWRATNKQQTYKVNVGVDTYNGTTKLGYNSKTQTMTYVNANPTQTVVVTETNQNVINVLGNDSTATYVVQNASELQFASTPSTLKYATVKNVSLYYNGVLKQSITTSSYTFNPIKVETNTFNVVATDSRNLQENNEIKWTTNYYIEYIPINIDSFSFKRENPTSSDIVLNATIKYKQTTFKSTANVPTIKWKVGEQGTLNTISSSDYTIDTTNDTITITNLVLSNVLSYQNSEKMYLYVNDLLTQDTENMIVTKGIPTFDAGEHDFQVNGDLFVADVNRQNKIDASKIIRARNEAIVIGLSSDITINPTVQYQRTKLNLSLEMGKLGDKLTLTNGGVKIGKGISKVRVSANGVLSGSTQLTGIIIKKNGDDTYRTFMGSTSTSFLSCSISDGILDVQENDLISLYVYTNTTTESRTVRAYDGYATYLCVEAVY